MPIKRQEGGDALVPQFISAADWSSLAALVGTLWLFALSTVVFAVNLLLGHAIIPSLAATGQLPPGVERLRLLFYLVAILALGADVLIVLRLGGQAGILQMIYPRSLI